MMPINGTFGHWQTWLLLAAAWLSLGALFAVALGLVARVGAWRERRNGQ